MRVKSLCSLRLILLYYQLIATRGVSVAIRNISDSVDTGITWRAKDNIKFLCIEACVTNRVHRDGFGVLSYPGSINFSELYHQLAGQFVHTGAKS